jgi:4-diphosphocytidyl-2-C-methyl-D-erythritol kinase
MSSIRQARLKAFAKINLSLVVLNHRADGFHDLRTVFQSISLGDDLTLRFEKARRTRIEVECEPDIPGNLAESAAEQALDAMGIRGIVRITLNKHIPMGGGLGGGSSDAAAVLLALPVLAGGRMEESQLHQIAANLGSDVPYFLMGGTALGVGRGEELYRLPPVRARHVLVVIPAVQVSTAEAYAALGRPMGQLTGEAAFIRMKRFQSFARALDGAAREADWKAFSGNDFEAAVYKRHPLLHNLQRKLERLGARPARMSGSGSTLFGVFGSPEEMKRAREALDGTRGCLRVETVKLMTREQYRAAYWRALDPHMRERLWPPLSRYVE